MLYSDESDEYKNRINTYEPKVLYTTKPPRGMLGENKRKPDDPVAGSINPKLESKNEHVTHNFP